MDFNSNKPIFISLKEHYERLIKTGVLKPGQEMPSVREVALLNGINPNTVQRAFSLLVESGFLTSIPKKGFFVSNIRGEDREILLRDSLQKLLDEGFTEEEIVRVLGGLKKND